MHVIANPADMTAEQRRSELASILAAGFLRHRARRGHVPPPDRAAEKGSERLSESAGGVRRNEAQCPPRSNDQDGLALERQVVLRAQARG